MVTEDVKTLMGLAIDFDQECILVSDNFRNTKLVYSNGKEQAIGKLRAISKEQAHNSGNYTYCPDLETYYQAS